MIGSVTSPFLSEKQGSLNSGLRSVFFSQPQSPPLLRRESSLYSLARSSNFSPECRRVRMASARARRTSSPSAGVLQLDQAEVDGVLLVELVFVLFVETVRCGTGLTTLSELALLRLHVVIDDVLFRLLAVVLHRLAAGAQVSQELGAVVVELVGQAVGDVIVDEAVRDVALVVLVGVVEGPDDQHPVDQLLNDTVLELLKLLVEFVLVVGLALDLGDEGLDFPADVVDRDDLVVGDRDDPIGEAQAEIVSVAMPLPELDGYPEIGPPSGRRPGRVPASERRREPGNTVERCVMKGR